MKPPKNNLLEKCDMKLQTNLKNKIICLTWKAPSDRWFQNVTVYIYNRTYLQTNMYQYSLQRYKTVGVATNNLHPSSSQAPMTGSFDKRSTDYKEPVGIPWKTLWESAVAGGSVNRPFSVW